MDILKRFAYLLVVALLLGWAISPLALADPTDKATLGGQDSSGNYHWRVDLNGNLIPGTTEQNSIGDSTHKVEEINVETITGEEAVYVNNVQFQTTVFASGHDSGATILASTVTPLTSANIAFGLIQLAHGSPGIHDIPDGVTGKTIIIELLADPSYIFGDDTATTKTGWATITFDTAYDKIMLTWLDDTTGWVIANNDGCVIGY